MKNYFRNRALSSRGWREAEDIKEPSKMWYTIINGSERPAN